MDNINLTVSNKFIDESITVNYQYDDCYKCLNINKTVENESNETISLLSNSIVNLFISDNNKKQICSYKLMTESGCSYRYIIQRRFMFNMKFGNASLKTNCTMMPDANNSYDYLLPLYVALILLCFFGALYYTILMLYRHRVFQKFGSRIFLYKVDLFEDFGRPGTMSSIASDNEIDNRVGMSVKWSTERRLKGLDCFRGLCVALMIFVNYGGGHYWFFEHSKWNGLTLADLVFPWFVFVMGVTLSICIFRALKNDNTKWYWLKTWANGGKRSIILFIIGIALESPSCKGNLEQLRIMGPLQRLAVAFFCLMTVICIVSQIQSRCNRGHTLLDENERFDNSTEINSIKRGHCVCKSRVSVTDLWFSMPYILISFGLLLTHVCVSLIVPVPSCGTGYLGPGGIGDMGNYTNCSGGVAGYIDRLLLTPSHMYQSPTFKQLYQTRQPFDPEGILGFLSCTALCFIGFWAGNVMLLYSNWTAAIKRLFIYALICTAIGVGLCQAKANGGFIPINKNLWSVSYVLISAGTSFFLLAFLFTTVDVLKLWNGSPFRYPGMNPIVIYCGHILLRGLFPIQWSVLLTYTSQLIINIWGVVFWTWISYIMFTKNLFISV